MKKLLLFMFLSCCGLAKAQTGSISFENTWKKGSNIVYLGVENEVILSGNLTDVKNIRCSSGSLLRRGDTLLIKNNFNGPFRIEIEKSDGVDSFLLNAERLPMPEISISGGSGFMTDIQKEKILASPELTVSAMNSRNENIFQDFKLVQYEIAVGNVLFKQSSTVFSEDLRAAIGELESGKTFSVNYVTILNPETGKKLTIQLHRVFRLN